MKRDAKARSPKQKAAIAKLIEKAKAKGADNLKAARRAQDEKRAKPDFAAAERRREAKALREAEKASRNKSKQSRAPKRFERKARAKEKKAALEDKAPQRRTRLKRALELDRSARKRVFERASNGQFAPSNFRPSYF